VDKVQPLDGGLARPALASLSPRVLREQVRDSLRNAILSAALPPGTKIGEAETAAALSVSRTPVREAIRELAEEGLLTFVPHRGAVVATVSNDEIDLAYRVLAVLEEAAMARAAVRMVPGDFRNLDRIIADMAHLAAIGDFMSATEADTKFHATIADVAQLGLLRRTWRSVDDLGRVTTRQLFENYTSLPTYLGDLVSSHQALVSTLRMRDPAAAAEAAREHLEDTHRRFLADMERHDAHGASAAPIDAANWM
jgi:DNA-binding GntR family transcriptional regulator